MSFVFISHANADKPRIKCVTDHLIQQGFILWLDKPEKMEYPAATIKKSFHRIPRGERYEDEIDNAVDQAGCVLFLASGKFFEEERKRWQREVQFACMKRTLLVVRIDDIDLKAAPLDEDLFRFQRSDIFLPDTPDKPLCQLAKINMGLLDDDIEKLLGKRSGSRYGRYNRTPSGKSPEPPTDEQISRFLMMIDREEVSMELASRNMTLSLVSADEHARPGHMKRRLPEVDLPCLNQLPVTASGDISPDYCDFKELRAGLLRGEFWWGGHKWFPAVTQWPNIAHKSTGDAADNFVEMFIQNSSIRLSPRNPQHNIEQRVQEFADSLSRSPLNCFLTCSFEDKPFLRKKNAALITRLEKLLRNIPPDRFRLMVHVAPTRKSPRFRKQTCTWLNSVANSVQVEKSFTLGTIGRYDILEWCELMAKIVDKTTDNIRDTVMSVFDRHSNDDMTFYELEQQMEPIIRSWHMRPRPAAAVPAARQMRWKDEF